MKTIQFTGTENETDNLKESISKYTNQNNFPQQTETRVYVIEAQQSLRFNEKIYTTLTDEEFMSIAEENGTVYSVQVFQQAFNDEDFNSDQVIRFINVPLN
jgi:hypothetical protein